MLRVKRLVPDIKLPAYAHPDDAGMDLYSAEDKLIQPGEHCTVRTGIAVAIPKGFVGLVWDKSGIASKGLKTMGGVLDSNYRGEVIIILKNISEKPYDLKKNNKIAQLLLQPIEHRPIVEVQELDDTDRGARGLGSTGLH
jgi:dUTP pyrophosphatase